MIEGKDGIPFVSGAQEDLKKIESRRKKELRLLDLKDSVMGKIEREDSRKRVVY